MGCGVVQNVVVAAVIFCSIRTCNWHRVGKRRTANGIHVELRCRSERGPRWQRVEDKSSDLQWKFE